MLRWRWGGNQGSREADFANRGGSVGVMGGGEDGWYRLYASGRGWRRWRGS